MQIDPTILEEKNYTGTRLIEITDATVLDLFEKRRERINEKLPILEKMEGLSKPVDEFYKKIRPLEEERQKLKNDAKPALDAYQEQVDEVEKIQQKADLIDRKIQPLIAKIIKAELGEFETARTLVERDGKLFVEVADEIEEKVKAIRANKSK